LFLIASSRILFNWPISIVTVGWLGSPLEIAGMRFYRPSALPDNQLAQSTVRALK